MKVSTTSKLDLSPTQLAEALAEATPEEFAQFWFKFYEITEKDQKEERLHLFAKAMAPICGSNRKKPLNRLHDLIKFYQEQERLQGLNQGD